MARRAFLTVFVGLVDDRLEHGAVGADEARGVHENAREDPAEQEGASLQFWLALLAGRDLVVATAPHALVLLRELLHAGEEDLGGRLLRLGV